MKKITAIALLSIAIVSCQKETKTVTKVDPKTGKIVNQALGYKSTEQLIQIGEQTQQKKKSSIWSILLRILKKLLT